MILALEAEVAVHPVGDAGQAAVAVHGHGGGAVEDGGGVEDVVDFLVLEQAVGVDAGAGHVEVTAHEGLTRG